MQVVMCMCVSVCVCACTFYSAPTVEDLDIKEVESTWRYGGLACEHTCSYVEKSMEKKGKKGIVAEQSFSHSDDLVWEVGRYSSTSAVIGGKNLGGICTWL